MNPEPSTWEQVERLVRFAQSIGFSKLSRAWEYKYLSQRHNPLVRIAFIGEFNHGKSSLINGIIGQRVLPTGMTPTTQVDTIVRFGAESSSVTAWDGDHCIETWELQNWNAQASKLTRECLKKHFFDSILIQLTQKAPFTDCLFIDTPGLNEASTIREHDLSGHLMDADLVVFVCDANQAMTHVESNLLQRIAQGIPESKRILVVNKCDALEDNDLLEVCHHVESSTAKILGDRRFYMVSARTPNHGDWNAWLQRLRHEVTRQYSHDDPERAAKAAHVITPILQGLLPICRHASLLPRDRLLRIAQTWKNAPPVPKRELSRILSSASDQIENLKTQILHDRTRFEQAFLNAIPRELDKATLEDIENYLEPFIDEQFRIFFNKIKEQLISDLNQLYTTLLMRLTQDNLLFGENDDTPEMNATEGALESIDSLIQSMPPTGAFDETALFSGRFLAKTLPLTRIEKPRRAALRRMAENAIQRRSAAFQIAFDADLRRFGNSLSGWINESGATLRQLVAEMAEHWTTHGIPCSFEY